MDKISIPLILCAVCIGLRNCSESFDQRQTGDLNVQIGLKNIQLIALLKGGKEEYVDYDYAYDYSEMTIKPQNGTTSKPSNMTVTSTTPTPVFVENMTASIINSTITGTSDDLKMPLVQVDNGVTAGPLESMDANTTAQEVHEYYTDPVTTEKILASASSTVSTNDTTNGTNSSTAISNHCRRGFVKNNKGKCEYKIHGTTNALRRLVKLAHKIKLDRGLTET